MADADQTGAGEVYPPGSPDDMKQMVQLLNAFFTSKLRAIELYQQGLQEPLMASTGSTKSICHVDGQDDGDDGKIPDV